MSKQRIENTNFESLDESGSVHTISMATKFIDTSDLDEPVEWLRGLPVYSMANGNKLNAKADGTFVELRTGRIFRRSK